MVLNIPSQSRKIPSQSREDSPAKPKAEDCGAGSGTVAGLPPQVKYRSPDQHAWEHWTIKPARCDEWLLLTFFVNRRSVSDPEYGSTQKVGGFEMLLVLNS